MLTLIDVIAVSFDIQMVLSKPDFGAMAPGCFPSPRILHNRDMIYVAISILGATVMPHNLYLHSSIAQTRHYPLTVWGEREAIFLGTIDSTVALLFALFINAAILIVTGASFYGSGHHEVAEIQDAYKLLSPLLGVGVASTLFAVACWPLARNSTLTSTLAGQVVMVGFLRIRLPLVLRRLITRAVGHHFRRGDRNRDHGESGAAQPLISQPGDPEYAVKLHGWFLGVTIAALSAFLLWQTFAGSGF